MKGHMKDGKFHPHTDYKKGVRKSRDQKAKTQGVKIRKQRLEGEQFQRDDRIETIEQISQEVLGEEKGTVIGRRFNDDGTISVEVVFDSRRDESSFFVNPTSLRKIDETRAEFEQKQKLCPVCGINPRGRISSLCDRCLKKHSAQKMRERSQEIFDTRVSNITEDLEEEGKSFKQIKKILHQRLGNRPKDLKTR